MLVSRVGPVINLRKKHIPLQPIYKTAGSVPLDQLGLRTAFSVLNGIHRLHSSLYVYLTEYLL